MKTTALFRRLAACLLLSAAPAAAQEISISDSSGSEDAGPLTVVFTVQLSAVQAVPVSFDFALTDGSAVATLPGFPGDYVIPAVLTDTIPAGLLSKTVTITIEPEAVQELAETFSITLSNPVNATIATGTATGTITESDIPVLGWDPGTADAGTVLFNRPAGSTSPFFMRMNPQAATHGWRSRLTFGAGEAGLSMAQGVLPDAGAPFISALPGADGFVARPDQFNAGDPWYLRVDFAGTPTWTVVSGEVFITNLGALPFTDLNGNLAYDIGEAVAPAPGGAVTMGPEQMRFFTVRIPAGTPGASLSLVADLRALAVRKTGAPFHDPFWFDHKQPGRMLLVPPYLGGSEEAVFLSVIGTPGEAISFDARIQAVTPLAFNVATGAVPVPAGPPYRVFRVDVPPNTIAWDAALTSVVGESHVALRRDLMPSEWFNDAVSEADAPAVDTVTLVPPFLTDGTWYITVYGDAPYTFNLFQGPPAIPVIPYLGATVNPAPLRAGWQHFVVTNIASQTGTLGWQLALTGQVPGTEIALRRNAVPSRWQSRNAFDAALSEPAGPVDFFTPDGLLQRPGHQADVWYVGVFLPGAALGAFTLTRTEIVPTPVAWNAGTAALGPIPPQQWSFFQFDVPAISGPPGTARGWDLAITGNTTGDPQMVICRDQLPDALFPAGWGTASSITTWPSGAIWGSYYDATGRWVDAGDGRSRFLRNHVSGMGRPLEPGRYFVGVRNESLDTPANGSLGSSGIGEGIVAAGVPFTLPVNTLAFAGGSVAVSGLAPRQARYFKVAVPAGVPAWEVMLTASVGESLLLVRRGTVPDHHAGEHGEAGVPVLINGTDAQVKMKKTGNDRYLMLPPDGAATLPADDYFLAVVSEGDTPPDDSTTGAGGSDFTLTSVGVPPVTAFPAWVPPVIAQPVTAFAAGQFRLFTFNVPVGTTSFSAELTGATGDMVISIVPGTLMPGANVGSTTYNYGLDGGTTTGASGDDRIINIANPVAGTWSMSVGAAKYNATTAAITLTRGTTPALAFDGGTSAVAAHLPETWRYFTVTVPAAANGWDLRLTNVTAGSPALVVRRVLLPQVPQTSFWYPQSSLTWPAGESWGGMSDWTGRTFDPGGPHPYSARLIMGAGRPLQPLAYFVGVYNQSADTNAAYTLQSRGIGAGLTFPVTALAFSGAGSSLAVPLTAAREVRYFSIAIPAGTPRWEFTFTPTNPGTDDHVVAVRRGTVPDFAAHGGGNLNDPEATDAELLLAKSGPERFMMLPEHGAGALVAGTYFIAVMSEGGNLVDNFTTGAASAGGTLTSLGVPPVTALGVVPAAAAPHSLAPGQFRLFNFTVPAGVTSMTVNITGRAEEQFFAIIPGAVLPDMDINAGSAYSYGQDGGEQGPGRLDDTDIITVNSPSAGVWSAIVGAYSLNTAPATGTLTITTQAAPVIAFDGGFQSVSGQGPGAWRYFTVTVPPAALGWDVRIRDITGGLPRMIIRKDTLPVDAFADAFDTTLVWPDNGTMHGTVDWSGRPTQDNGIARYAQRRVTGRGRPLTTGTYIVGVINDDAVNAADYVVESRGIGAGLTLPVTPLALAGGSVAIAGLQPHEARYFSVVVPANVASWRLNLAPALGEMMMVVRRGSIPGLEASWSGEAGTPNTDQGYDLQVEMQKDGAETYLMLPPEGATTLVAGTYFIAVISEGVDPMPGLPGIGPVSGTLTSTSPQGIVGLGAAGPVPVLTPIALSAGRSQLFAFNVPAGTALLETRLDERAGDPAAFLAAGTRFPQLALGGGSLFDYGNDGGSYTGVNHESSRTIISTRLPQPGAHRLVVSSSYAEDSTATLSLRTVAFAPLSFDAALNGAGVLNTASRLLLDGQRALFQVEVPPDVSGTVVEGWQLSVNELLGNARIRVFRNWGEVSGSVQVDSNNVVILTTPWLERCRSYYIELEGDGLTDVTLTSSMVRPQIPPLTMPAGFNNTFGDTGAVDIADNTWHFYAVEVPTDNSGLLRTALEAISGNPDLYLREDGVPSTDGAIFGGNTGYHRSLTDLVSEYGNWVPVDGKTQPVRLRPGRWWLAVRAAGGSNARYRLILSNGQVTDLPSLNNPAFTAQNLVGGDWRYYRVTVPANNFATWSRTFSQQLGDVVMHLRDTVPPGSGRYAWGEFHNAAGDAKNSNTWPVNGDDDPGTYTDTTAPLRPGATYFVGFRAKEDSTFTFTSSGFSGPVLSTFIDFYTGSFSSAALAPGTSQMRRVFAPALAGRWRHTFTTTSPDLSVTIEQGTLPPALPGIPHYQWSGDHFHDTEISPVLWPWQPAQTYWVRVTNNGIAAAPFTFTMNGTNDPNRVDTDSDLMADGWEMLHFGNLAAGPNDDADLDGASNRVEFGFGTDPRDSGSKIQAGIGLPTPLPIVRLTYLICVPEVPPAFLRYTIEVSSDMITWTPVATKAPGAAWTEWTGVGEVFPPVPTVPALVCITIADCEPLAANPRRFMRAIVGP